MKLGFTQDKKRLVRRTAFQRTRPNGRRGEVFDWLRGRPTGGRKNFRSAALIVFGSSAYIKFSSFSSTKKVNSDLTDVKSSLPNIAGNTIGKFVGYRLNNIQPHKLDFNIKPTNYQINLLNGVHNFVNGTAYTGIGIGITLFYEK